MKKIVIILTALLALSLLCGCGNGAAPAAEIPNPVRDSSAEEILAEFGAGLVAPQGAQDAVYGIIDGKTPLAQLSFSLDGVEYTCRMAGAKEYTDISGMYFEWQNSELLMEANDYELCFNPDAEGFIAWYDETDGLVRCISMNSGASEQSLIEAAHAVFPDETDAPDPAAAARLRDMFDRIIEDYYPGTAGSSLTAARLAAELADVIAESGFSPEQVEWITYYYARSMDASMASYFGQQMDAIIASFDYIRTESGSGLLADSGYESAYYPWDDGVVEQCVHAIPIF